MCCPTTLRSQERTGTVLKEYARPAPNFCKLCRLCCLLFRWSLVVLLVLYLRTYKFWMSPNH